MPGASVLLDGLELFQFRTAVRSLPKDVGRATRFAGGYKNRDPDVLEPYRATFSSAAIFISRGFFRLKAPSKVWSMT